MAQPATWSAEVWKKAKEAAQEAAIKKNASLGAEAFRGFDCGFAWITIKPARGPFVKYLKDNGIGSRGGYGGGGYGIWYSDVHSVNTQSMSVHEAAVDAAVKVLIENGIEASWNSRLD